MGQLCLGSENELYKKRIKNRSPWFQRVLWAKLCSLSNSCVEVLTPSTSEYILRSGINFFFCFVNKFICTIFLDSTYKLYNMVFVFDLLHFVW